MSQTTHRRPRPRRLRRIDQLERGHRASPPPPRVVVAASTVSIDVVAVANPLATSPAMPPTSRRRRAIGGPVLLSATPTAAWSSPRPPPATTTWSPWSTSARSRPTTVSRPSSSRSSSPGAPWPTPSTPTPSARLHELVIRPTCSTTSSPPTFPRRRPPSWRDQRPVTQAALSDGLPTETPAWKDIPSWFVVRGPGPQHPRRAAPLLRRACGRPGTREVAGGSHALSVSQPDVVAATILDTLAAM